MFVSYKWLENYVDLDGISPEELAEKITRSGIEVEGVASLGKGLKGVVVGEVLECNKHPEADKLNICLVNVGEEENKQIICGAPNVAKGQKVAVAKVGAVLPGNFKIKKAKLRGEVSEGMICSLQELGIESKLIQKEFSSGIFVFPNDTEVGLDALEQLNLNDHILELSLTPNRADCLSMLGVAYEVAAILGKDVKLPDTTVSQTSEKASEMIQIKIEATEDNPYYAARVVKNVKIGPSPLWMQTYLMAAGIRPISNVVDITNYILLEYGQPLHAFDYDKLGSKEIVVRKASAGEKIVTLDDQERTLTEEHLVITNGKVPVALAGVMGGATSEVSNETTTVLIESAIFNSITIRKASKDHGLRSEASTRYEKGVDPLRAPLACDRAAQLMAKYASGEILEGKVVADYLTVEQKVISITVEKINQILGTSIEKSVMEDIFKRLQFTFETNGNEFTVTAPTRRGDITIQEDLVEEVARLYGYDNLPTTLPIGESIPGKLTDYQAKRRRVRRYFEGLGMNQAITYSLTSNEKVKQYIDESLNSVPIKLSMPMSEERGNLRLSVIPHLLEVVSYNQARKVDNVALYEVGSVFLSDSEIENDLPKESERLAAVLSGNWFEHAWQGEKKRVDFFVLKGIVEGLFDLLGLGERVRFVQEPKDGLHPGRSAGILLDNEYLGFIGQIHPVEQKRLDITETYVFELSLEKLLFVETDEVAYSSIPRFPSMSRDTAFIVDVNVAASDIKDEIRSVGGELLKEITVFDVYQGEHVEAGKKSIAFSMKYFDPNRTLTDEEVQKAHENTIHAVINKFGAVVRG